jgi:hypothetical protein
MNFWTDAFFFAMAVAIAILWAHTMVRSRRLRKIMAELEFVETHDIPASLTFRGTGLANLTATWNNFWGKKHGVMLVVFDCQIGHGEGKWRHTVIAAESLSNVFEATKFDSELVVEQTGDWMILYRPAKLSLISSGLMTAAEVRAHLDNI